MISFHIEMLFTNIPLDATINICDDELFENKTNKVNNLTKEYFSSLLKLTTLDSFFIFDGKYYKQKNGVVMGSTLDPTLEIQWISDCSIYYKPILYRGYDDDIFLLFSSESH